MSATLDRLKELGLTLPPAAAPVANYVGFQRSGNLVVISGQLPFNAQGQIDPAHKGKVGAQVSPEAAAEAARHCALNVLAQLRAAAGNLDDAVVACLRLGGFINTAPGFSAVAGVMNGASDLMVQVLGERGRHARSTIGVAELPLDAVVEVEGMFEIR
ncbi:Enamine deaminase RidA, house cleaning of reactive enamine intermediates, YjgF/YER057c/UK114 family [Methylobacterium sp. 174MFSha1.1]|uniref:RidA family protein n=1 Tax=Methylobacterium sp. 174MFSha1.1 TaxID=1502749 RepID=UPI0008EEB7D7|nr:RidA family protein [Methylobacterium sp. 174MFSha1.1]SFU87841.1 Enamine deaminase RidA, house cleaning of reactive enamine intermediates, YjgF/YER057c/UK114 family [Methylobacterium sp. 174MFSha1.1]